MVAVNDDLYKYLILFLKRDFCREFELSHEYGYAARMLSYKRKIIILSVTDLF